ncbi:MAG TPA: bifunctional salicylyl-CoA 5-hydroxylase/oxidoreductase, partial [Steroidobacteraceae bacterium]
PSQAAITGGFHHWDDIDVHYRGTVTTTGGHGFCGIARKQLLAILQERGVELGAIHHYQHEVEDDAAFADADLVIAADGVNSRTRRRHEAVFEPDIDTRECRYIWLGTTKPFPAFTFAFEETEHGWFQIHAYQFSKTLSTVIVETREETWRAHGLDRADHAQSIAFCEKLFAKYLDGHSLLSNAAHLRGSAWLNFQRVLCKRWHHGNRVLIGDAAHTAHFSIGSGTKLAMEDAIALVARTAGASDVPAALAAYQDERETEALKLQSAARNRMRWFEEVARYTRLPPWQFTYSLLTGSQRIGHANLKLRDPAFVADVEVRLADRVHASPPRPPMFLPFELRGMKLENRIVVSPMAQYSAKDGMPGDWHLVHLGARATGGAGLVFTEMTCVSPEGRISPGCTGLWNRSQRDAWRRIVGFAHTHGHAKLCMQLGHSGRKGSTQLGWEEEDRPLPSGNWPTLAPSALPYLEGISAAPRAMTRADMDRVRAEFVQSARFAAEAGFDMLEIHMAHGYLLASFLSPLTNLREDEYGGSTANRLRYPLEVLAAVRAAWPGKPLSVRLSSSDWAPGGLTEDELITVARAMQAEGADLLDLSSGQTVPWQKPVYGRMWQTPFSDLVRNVVGIPTIAVGNIFEADHANTIIASGRADLCALARPHLADPAWTLRAAAEQHWYGQWWPPQYRSAKRQLERNIERAAQMTGAV